jgi:hypothetical protein
MLEKEGDVKNKGQGVESEPTNWSLGASNICVTAKFQAAVEMQTHRRDPAVRPVMLMAHPKTANHWSEERDGIL